jgi:hypothetical protein
MQRLFHLNDKILRLLQTTSASFIPFLALLTLQLVFSVLSLLDGIRTGNGEETITSANIPAAVVLMPLQGLGSSMPPVIGALSLALGVSLWVSLLHIGYDLEKKRIRLDETCLIGGICGLLLGAVSVVIPVALLVKDAAADSMLLIAPLILGGLFGGVLFGLTMVGLGALVHKYALN